MAIAKQRGFALLEVLIAWALLTVVLLGLLRLQAHNLHDTAQAYWRSVALMQADVLLQQLELSHHLQSSLLRHWRSVVARRLPKGRGDYHCGAHRCTVRVHWQQQSEAVVVLSATR